MLAENSVTCWIADVRDGNALAAEQLWGRYFRQLMAQARMRMSNVSRSAYDEEDAALSTFHLLCQKLEEGYYPSLADRHELWQLMLTVLIRKVGRRVKYQTAAKRNPVTSHFEQITLEDLPATTTQEISQECYELITALNDPHLEQVAMLKFEGYTNDEIASKLNRTRRTIQRMLNLIRELWMKELEVDSQ